MRRAAALLLAAVIALAAGPAAPQVVAPHAIDIPPWFTDTLLDLREDVRDAAREGKRIMIYFGQDGCPYCRELMLTNFRQPQLVDKTRKHFIALALNIWGDREVTWIDGQARSEKDLARFLKVQFTPTLLFLDERGNVVARVNGYYPPRRFEAALDYVAGRMEGKLPFAEHMKSVARETASEKLHEQPFFLGLPYDLRRKKGGKPLAVLFETNYCAACDEMHREGFRRKEVLEQVKRFDVVRLHIGSNVELVRPDGSRSRADAWARALKITYTPTIVFFDERGHEVFRVEAYVRTFHLAGSFDYVASGAYRKEPSFQRFLQAKGEQLRDKGTPVDLWK